MYRELAIAATRFMLVAFPLSRKVRVRRSSEAVLEGS